LAAKASKQDKYFSELLPFEDEHYREVRRKYLIRLVAIYLAPMVIIIIYFYFQYSALVSENQRFHLIAIAENQSNTLDLFLSERIVNLNNVIDDPKFQLPPSAESMKHSLDKLKRYSKAFIDVGFFDSSGVQVAYEGPHPNLELRNYSSESWYKMLKNKNDKFIITDIYLGFREKPHFTIAVNRIIDNQYVVLRASLSPGEIYEYISSLKGAGEVKTSIVNRAGYYQLVTPQIGKPLDSAPFIPPSSPALGATDIKTGYSANTYAYAWLRNADWALLVQGSTKKREGLLLDFRIKLIVIGAIIISLMVFIIITRSRKLVELQKETDQARAQLEHAAKLASVGELAAGIAHEINNPLAVINEQAGLIKDILNPEFGMEIDSEQLMVYMNKIQKYVYRCRDITHKLLRFVRKTDMEMKFHNVNKLLSSVIDDLLGKEKMAVSNIEIKRNYCENLPELLTDGNQLQQVLLNIINNAIDAIDNVPGTITLTTSRENNSVRISISDTGKGMNSEQLKRIFLPFYTTKPVGKGTGLGLSVSYSIIKNLGGSIEVKSELNKGTTFSILLPI
jgi:two-component system NtrC family sensor kinase